MHKFARIVSTIFIPPSFTLISFLFIAIKDETALLAKLTVIFTAFIFGFALQLISFFYFYRKGIISDVDAKMKSERNFPYIVSILIFTIGLIVLLIAGVNKLAIAFWFCYISNTFIVILINRYFKISIHMMGAAGPFALFIFLLGFNAVIILPLLFVIGWSRLSLKVHTPAEVIIGALFGFFSVYFQLSIFLN